ncbi:hypothetical protein BC936DRAFT_142555 [Jimgerdemannia flammicorona]|uniref:EMC1 first beta-propeller domain-containing protein n=1 Tax=Jimgerdemannia flammicorona TaxID=994334 RepID=A0A433A089_9FUNG|nr:hypothetical protein BC936DRAFT_142555 [Jimgerdemannia flammicorona]
MTATSRSTPWPSSFTALLLLVLLLASTRVGAIYENQAGVKDWHHKWIGRPRFSLFHDNDDQTHLFAATELGVIASLNTTSGDIAWRHILNEPVYALTAKGGNLLSLSGSTARLWEASTGFLVWERATSPNKVVPGTAFFADNGNVLTLTAGSTVQKLSGKKGTPLRKSSCTYRTTHLPSCTYRTTHLLPHPSPEKKPRRLPESRPHHHRQALRCRPRAPHPTRRRTRPRYRRHRLHAPSERRRERNPRSRPVRYLDRRRKTHHPPARDRVRVRHAVAGEPWAFCFSVVGFGLVCGIVDALCLFW